MIALVSELLLGTYTSKSIAKFEKLKNFKSGCESKAKLPFESCLEISKEYPRTVPFASSMSLNAIGMKYQHCNIE